MARRPPGPRGVEHTCRPPLEHTPHTDLSWKRLREVRLMLMRVRSGFDPAFFLVKSKCRVHGGHLACGVLSSQLGSEDAVPGALATRAEVPLANCDHVRTDANVQWDPFDDPPGTLRNRNGNTDAGRGEASGCGEKEREWRVFSGNLPHAAGAALHAWRETDIPTQKAGSRAPWQTLKR